MDPLRELEEISERGEKGGVNFIPCLKWVQRGVAKSTPEKVKLTQEELAAIIQQAQSKLEDLEFEEKSDEDNDGVESEIKKEPTEDVPEADVIKKEVESEQEMDPDDFEKRYGLDTYDEEDENPDNGLGLGSLVSFADPKSDPYLINPDVDEDASDVEDFQIKATDNLLLVGHVEGNAAILEVYVYNDVEDAFYIHHDVLLPSYPLALEWLNYDAGEKARGNFVAVGTMDPIIEIWDLDMVDCLEPAYVLGKKEKKKKKSKAKVKGFGHKDAVLSLAWNKNAEHVLASGSVDETVILWDLTEGKIATTLKAHQEKIQALQWHPFEAQTLLTGCCDEIARTFDCRSENAFKSWKVLGEVEKVLWNQFNPYTFVVGTDKGNIHMMDIRVDNKSVWTLNAHFEAVNGLVLSSQCPDCLITGSSDKTVKIWDISNNQPACIQERNVSIGTVHCLEGCPDAPFVIAMGGDNPSDNVKLFDIRESAAVRSRFGDRKLQNPLSYASFGFETANEADIETMEDDVKAVSLDEQPREDMRQQTSGGGAVAKFKKDKKKKKKPKQHF